MHEDLVVRRGQLVGIQVDLVEGFGEPAMSGENVEIIRRAYEAANRDDVDSAVADFAPDC